MENPWKRTITAPQEAVTFIDSWHCCMARSLWYFSELCTHYIGKVAIRNTITTPRSAMLSVLKLQKLKTITKQLHIFIRQYTVLFVIIFPATHFCPDQSVM